MQPATADGRRARVGVGAGEGGRAGSGLGERTAAGDRLMEGQRIRAVDDQRRVVVDPARAERTACAAIPHAQCARGNRRAAGVVQTAGHGEDAVARLGDCSAVPESRPRNRQVARWIGAAGDIQCRRNARVDVQATAPGDKVTRTTGRGVGVAHPVDDARVGAGVECVAATRAKCDRAGRTAFGVQIESCGAEGQRSPIVDREPTADITTNVTRTRTQNQPTGIHRRHPTISVGAVENGRSRSILG